MFGPQLPLTNIRLEGRVFTQPSRGPDTRKPVSSSVMGIKPGTVWQVGRLGGWRQKDQVFKVILGYVVSVKLAWATG